MNLTSIRCRRYFQYAKIYLPFSVELCTEKFLISSKLILWTFSCDLGDERMLGGLLVDSNVTQDMSAVWERREAQRNE